MQYLPTAFAQLEFAWKLYNYALEGKIDLDDLDKPLAFQDGQMVLVLPDRIFGSPEDLIIALENNLSVAFGAAAITLNRSREEVGLLLPNPIENEIDQFVSLTYQIRNAFAHDISEPRGQSISLDLRACMSSATFAWTYRTWATNISSTPTLEDRAYYF